MNIYSPESRYPNARDDLMELLIRILQTGQLSTGGAQLDPGGDINFYSLTQDHADRARRNRNAINAAKNAGVSFLNEFSTAAKWLEDNLGLTAPQAQSIATALQDGSSLVSNMLPNEIKHIIAGQYGSKTVAFQNMVERQLLGHYDSGGRAFADNHRYIAALGRSYNTIYDDAERASGAPNYREITAYQNYLQRTGELAPRTLREHIQERALSDHGERVLYTGILDHLLETFGEGMRISADTDADIVRGHLSAKFNTDLESIKSAASASGLDFDESGVREAFESMSKFMVESEKTIAPLREQANSLSDQIDAARRAGENTAKKEEDYNKLKGQILEKQKESNDHLVQLMKANRGLEQYLELQGVTAYMDIGQHKYQFDLLHQVNREVKSALTLLGYDTSLMSAEDVSQTLEDFTGHSSNVSNLSKRAQASELFTRYVDTLLYGAKGYSNQDIELLYGTVSKKLQGTSLERHAGQVSSVVANKLAVLSQSGNTWLNTGVMGQSDQTDVTNFIRDKTMQGFNSDMTNVFGAALSLGLVTEQDLADGTLGGIETLQRLTRGDRVTKAEAVGDFIRAGRERGREFNRDLVDLALGDATRNAMLVLNSDVSRRAVSQAASRQMMQDYMPKTPEEWARERTISRHEERLNIFEQIIQGEDTQTARDFMEVLTQIEAGTISAEKTHQRLRDLDGGKTLERLGLDREFNEQQITGFGETVTAFRYWGQKHGAYDVRQAGALLYAQGAPAMVEAANAEIGRKQDDNRARLLGMQVDGGYVAMSDLNKYIVQESGEIDYAKIAKDWDVKDVIKDASGQNIIVDGIETTAKLLKHIDDNASRYIDESGEFNRDRFADAMKDATGVEFFGTGQNRGEKVTAYLKENESILQHFNALFHKHDTFKSDLAESQSKLKAEKIEIEANNVTVTGKDSRRAADSQTAPSTAVATTALIPPSASSTVVPDRAISDRFADNSRLSQAVRDFLSAPETEASVSRFVNTLRKLEINEEEIEGLRAEFLESGRQAGQLIAEGKREEAAQLISRSGLSINDSRVATDNRARASANMSSKSVMEPKAFSVTGFLRDAGIVIVDAHRNDFARIDQETETLINRIKTSDVKPEEVEKELRGMFNRRGLEHRPEYASLFQRLAKAVSAAAAVTPDEDAILVPPVNAGSDPAAAVLRNAQEITEARQNVAPRPVPRVPGSPAQEPQVETSQEPTIREYIAEVKTVEEGIEKLTAMLVAGSLPERGMAVIKTEDGEIARVGYGSHGILTDEDPEMRGALRQHSRTIANAAASVALGGALAEDGITENKNRLPGGIERRDLVDERGQRAYAIAVHSDRSTQAATALADDMQSAVLIQPLSTPSRDEAVAPALTQAPAATSEMIREDADRQRQVLEHSEQADEAKEEPKAVRKGTFTPAEAYRGDSRISEKIVKPHLEAVARQEAEAAEKAKAEEKAKTAQPVEPAAAVHRTIEVDSPAASVEPVLRPSERVSVTRTPETAKTPGSSEEKEREMLNVNARTVNFQGNVTLNTHQGYVTGSIV